MFCGKTYKTMKIGRKCISTKSQTRFKEVRSNSRVATNSLGNLTNIGGSLFADTGNGVDAADSLCQKRVGDQLADLSRLCGHCEDLLVRYPPFVDTGNDGQGPLRRWVGLATEYDAIWIQKTFNHIAFGDELGI